MATNVPPHNLGEVIDGVVAIIEDPDVSIRQLMKTVKGPDFPTAGLIMGREGIKEAYETGRYDRTDYRRPLDPPLSPEDAAWAADLLRKTNRV